MAKNPVTGCGDRYVIRLEYLESDSYQMTFSLYSLVNGFTGQRFESLRSETRDASVAYTTFVSDALTSHTPPPLPVGQGFFSRRLLVHHHLLLRLATAVVADRGGTAASTESYGKKLKTKEVYLHPANLRLRRQQLSEGQTQGLRSR